MTETGETREMDALGPEWNELETYESPAMTIEA